MPISIIKPTLIAALLCGGVHISCGQAPAKEQEAKLIAVLQSNADHLAKADACRELARSGTADAVPALAALLADEKLNHMARYGLEAVPSPVVDAALRDALGKLKGRPLVGVIGSIGVRHDEKAVGALVGLLKDADTEVVQSAARALGMIGSDDAVKGLLDMLPGATAANQLACCEGLFRCAEARIAKGRNDKAIAIYDTLRNLKQAPHQVLAGAWRGAIIAR
ncbi:MAG: HEAT repeat domain-containing protein, partial [Verrucomicrobia bacterium]|nr:HEAT repeat domain-containing protein [Verrucomicrobiota bacterium]